MKLLTTGAAFLPTALLWFAVAPTESCARRTAVPVETAEAGRGEGSEMPLIPIGGAGDQADLAAPGATSEALQAAIDRGLVFVERDGADWMAGRNPFQSGKGCVSCHHVGFALWSQREALRAGVAVPADRVAAMDELEATARAFIATPKTGRTVSWGQLLLGRRQPETDPEAAADWLRFHRHIAAAQHGDGYWEAKGQFPRQNRSPQESDDVATLWTLLALHWSLDDPSLENPAIEVSTRDADPTRAHRQRALGWLAAAEPGRSNEWLAAKLLVEAAFGDPENLEEVTEEVENLRRKLLAQQHEDGGWSWLAEDPSNAYSTGQTLYALRISGLSPDHPALRLGVAYLLDTQGEDGTWPVPSRLTSAEESSEKDYIYTYWGTAWAVLGLSRSLGSPESPEPAGATEVAVASESRGRA